LTFFSIKKAKDFFMNKKSILPEPGLRIRNLRKKLGLTRGEFHEKTGISASTLRAWEVGEAKLSPPKALTLSHMFILLFKLKPEEASQDVLLNGGKSDDILLQKQRTKNGKRNMG
jgi:transcriptional regulator with XRE-family HTH domain